MLTLSLCIDQFAIISNSSYLSNTMSFTTFEPQSTSTPKKLNLCSTPRPGHIRYSLSKCALLPVDSSTPNTKKTRKSFAPNIHRLIYPANIPITHSIKIWVL